MITRPIASNILLDLYTAAERIIADAFAIQLPMQLFISGSDCVVNTKPQHLFFENYGCPIKEKYVLVYYIDEIAECVEYARKIADKYGWKVVMMSNTYSRFPGVDKNIPFCGPGEFLWLFDHAEYIVTNKYGA